MARRPALRALADRLGILPAYQAAGSGRRRVTSDATRVALLAALGIDAGDESAARHALEALEAEQQAQALDPVQLVGAGRRARLRLRQPGAMPVRWELQVQEEDGPVHAAEGRWRRGAAGPRLPRLPPGVHEVRLVLHGPGTLRHASQTLVVAPAACCDVAELLGRRRVFGLWTHLYTLRGTRDLGVGNLTDLCALARFAGRIGAAFVGLNPLHAVRNRMPEISPYSPVSRLFRNPLYLDPTATPEWKQGAGARLVPPARVRELTALRRAGRVRYERVSALQRPLLAELHRRFRRIHGRGATPRGRAFATFCARGGELLRQFAIFSALEEHLAARGHARDWRSWPRGYREPAAPGVRDFAAAHARAVEREAWIQFELDRQLGEAARTARRAGLALGLYQDLALGSIASGFDAWAFPGLFVDGASLGAPPDEYSTTGQDWGLPPLAPRRLAAQGFRYWTLLLRAAFAHAGALRIDHVMGLFRQWWIPAGRPASEGAYVRFPADALLAVLALESRRHGALVVGEDLGTVPRGLPARLARAGVLSSRVLLFERDRRGRFRPASRYSRRALVTANTHDLPTLAGFWEGRDLVDRRTVGAIPDAAAFREAQRQRAWERRALLRRLAAEGLAGRTDPPPAYPELSAAVHAFLCRTPAPLVGVALDDLSGETEALNLPGVSPERHPSWTRRMRLRVDALGRDPGVRRALAGLASRASR